MLRKWLLIGLVLILLVIIGGVVGCGGGGGSPSDVVKTYYSALNAGDFDKAEACLAPGTELAEWRHQYAGNIEKIEILDVLREEVFGVEVAEVTVELTLIPGCESSAVVYGGTRTVVVEKHESGWKLSWGY